jgi:hypothetical protein
MAFQGTSLLALSRVAAGSISAQRFVSAAGTQTGADGNAIGVARTAASAGDLITVDGMGTAPVEAGGSFSKGATLKSDSAGRAIQWATSGARLAIALEASGGAGQVVEVILLSNAA